jgi:hypothetical protein
MKKYLYYHIYLTEETGCWYNQFLEQVVSTIDSGLYEHIEKMYVVCIGKKEEVEMFTCICNTFTKVEILEKKEKKLTSNRPKMANLVTRTHSLKYWKKKIITFVFF